MSYNIDNSEYLSQSRLYILGRDAFSIQKDFKDNLPERNFIGKVVDKWDGKSEEPIEVEKFWWSGEHSGYAYHEIMKDVASKLIGYAEVILTWEDGSVSGVIFDHGKVIECEVTQALVKK